MQLGGHPVAGIATQTALSCTGRQQPRALPSAKLVLTSSRWMPFSPYLVQGAAARQAQQLEVVRKLLHDASHPLVPLNDTVQLLALPF